MILGRSGIRAAFESGRGSLVVRAKAEFEEMRGGRTALVVTEIPYQVNKNSLLEKIAELVRSKQVEGISDMRDESDRDGMRIVIELKRDATPEVVLNHLYRFTQLQTSFGVNFLALDGGRPRLMGLKDALEVFLVFREEVVLRRSRFELAKARDRAHLLVGLAIAVANIDEVIHVIRTSPDAATARAALMGRDWPAGGRGAAARAGGRQRQPDRERHRPADRRAGARHPGPAAGAADRARAREDPGRPDRGGRRDHRACSRSWRSRPRRLEVIRDELHKVRAEIASAAA